MARPITRQELQERLANREVFTLVEALPVEYFDQGHLPGALNLPHDCVDELAPQLLPDKTATIVVYCANGPCANSGIAAERLVTLGYIDVYEYDEGKEDWVQAGLPLETTAQSEQVS